MSLRDKPGGIKNNSMINIGLALGQRDIKEELYKENYFIIKLGFNLTSKWFIKRKFM